MKVLSVVHIKSDRLPGTGLCFRTCLVSLSFRLGLDRSSWRMFWDVLARFALPVQVVGCFWVQHAFTGFSCLEATVMILEVASSSYLTAPHWTSAWWVRSPTVRKECFIGFIVEGRDCSHTARWCEGRPPIWSASRSFPVSVQWLLEISSHLGNLPNTSLGINISMFLFKTEAFSI